MNADLPPDPASTDALSKELEDIVLRCLGNHLQQFRIDSSDKGIVINGFCDSYHAKQMAQEIVLKNTIQKIAANKLVVKALSMHAPEAEQPDRVDFKDSLDIAENDFENLPHRSKECFIPPIFLARVTLRSLMH